MNRRMMAFALGTLLMGARAYASESIEYYHCDFSQGIPEDITLYDCDGETLHYTMLQRGFESTDSWISLREEGTENIFAGSASRFKTEAGKSPASASDWLVLPEVWIRGGEGKLNWRSRIVNEQSSRPSRYEVRVSTIGPRPEDFPEKADMTVTEDSEDWRSRSLELSQYSGSHVWVAFVNVSNDGEILGIDDISIEGKSGIAEISVYPGAYAIGDVDGLEIGGSLTAGSEIPVTSFSATCEIKGETYEVSYTDLNLSSGESLDFTFPVKLSMEYGERLEYVVRAVVNDVVFDDIVQTTTRLAFLPERRVVIEEATGTWCQYCPMGTLALQILEEKYPDNFIPIAIHMIEGTDPMAMDSYANQNTFSGGAPSGWVDRKVYSTRPMVQARIDNQRTYTTLMGGFETLLLDRLAEIPMADVGLSAEISSSGMLEVAVASRFPVDVENADYRICIVLTEDHVAGSANDGYTQMNGYSGASEVLGGYENLPRIIVEDLEFNHVARAIYDDYNGIVNSLPASLKAGEEYTYESSRELPVNIHNKENLNVVAMLLDRSSGEVLNAASVRPVVSAVDMMEGVSADIEVKKNGTLLNVSSVDLQTEISVELIDVSGRTTRVAAGKGSLDIPTDGLKGFHLLMVRTDSGSICRKLLL